MGISQLLASKKDSKHANCDSSTMPVAGKTEIQNVQGGGARRRLRVGIALSSTLALGALATFLITNNNQIAQLFTQSAPTVQTDSAVGGLSFDETSHETATNMMENMSVDEIVDSMSVKDKVSQMFIVHPDALNGELNGSVQTEFTERMRQKLEEYQVGGVIYFRGNLVTQGASAATNETNARKLSEGLQNNSRYGMLISVDEEGGYVQRIGGPIGGYTTKAPTGAPAKATLPTGKRDETGAGIGTALENMSYYANSGVDTAYSNAQILAENCKKVGANWDFAPVADVDLKQGNAIAANGRTYSWDVNTASQLVNSAVKGFNASGVANSLKHFPGHGSLLKDTHGTEWVDSDNTLSDFQNNDIKVYRDILADGDSHVDSIMLAHIRTPNVTEAGNMPVSLNPYWINYIRNELHYDGIILTDGMEMGAMALAAGGADTEDGHVAVALKGFDAGLDIFLLSKTPFKAIDAIVDKVNADDTGALEQRLDESVKRILNMKRKYNIIPQQKQGDVTVVTSSGMETTTFENAWDEAIESSDASTSTPTIILRNNVTLNETLDIPAGSNIIIDLNGHELNGAGITGAKSMFNVASSVTNANTTVLIQDSSSDQSGKITGLNDSSATLATINGKASMVITCANITGNKCETLFNVADDGILILGTQYEDNQHTPSAGAVSVKGNNCSHAAIDLSGDLFLAGNVRVEDNGSANVCLEAATSMMHVLSDGLETQTNSIGVTVSDEKSSSLTIADTSSLDGSAAGYAAQAFVSDDKTYEFETSSDGSSIVAVSAKDDAMFVPNNAALATTYGTWKDVADAAKNVDGTITLLRNIRLTTDKPYYFNKNTVINLNGRHLDVTTTDITTGYFIEVSNTAMVTIEDSKKPTVKSELVQDVAAGMLADWNATTSTLTYYEDIYENGGLSTYKKTANLSVVGSIDVTHEGIKIKDDGSTELIANGIGRANPGGQIVINSGRFTSTTARAFTAQSGGTITFNNGYLVGCNSTGHASGLWSFGDNSTIIVNGGILADNDAKTESGSSGVLGAYSGSAKAIVHGGVFSGNHADNHAAAVSTGLVAWNWDHSAQNNNDTTNVEITGGTFCHNVSDKNGGAIHVNATKATPISNALISNNKAAQGGGIYMNNASKVKLSGDVIVMNNESASAGGGIYVGANKALSVKDNVVVKKNIAASMSRAATGSTRPSDIAPISATNRIAVSGPLTSAPEDIGLDIADPSASTKVAEGEGYTLTEQDAGKFFVDSANKKFTVLSSDGSISLTEGEVKYVSADGNTIRCGSFTSIWNEYFATGQGGTIKLEDNVTISGINDGNQLISSGENAVLDLNGYVLSFDAPVKPPIKVTAGSFEIADINDGQLVHRQIVSDASAGMVATWNANKLKYYTTEHEASGIVTYENVKNLEGVGAIECTSATTSDCLLDITDTGKAILSGGRLTNAHGRAVNASGESFKMTGGYIVGNHTKDDGGAIFMINANVTVSGGTIAANITEQNGGAIRSHRNEKKITISGKNTVISGNIAKKNGGAIYINGNTAWNGARDAFDPASLEITSSVITNNLANEFGGGIYIMQPHADSIGNQNITFQNAIISGNKAHNGGGVYSETPVIITMAGAHLDANEAVENSGGIRHQALVLDGACVQNNTAGGMYDGGVGRTPSGMEIKGKTLVKNNTAQGQSCDLDIRGVSSDKIALIGVDKTSRIGVKYDVDVSAVQNQKLMLVSGAPQNETYSNVLFDDNSGRRLLCFDDAVYAMSAAEDGEPLGGNVQKSDDIDIFAMNYPDLRGDRVGIGIHGPGNGIQTDYKYYSNLGTLEPPALLTPSWGGEPGSDNAQWVRAFFSPIEINGETYYRHSETRGYGTPGGVLPEGWIALSFWGGNDKQGMPPSLNNTEGAVRDPDQNAKKLLEVLNITPSPLLHEGTNGTIIKLDDEATALLNDPNNKNGINNNETAAQGTVLGHFSVIKFEEVEYKTHYIYYHALSDADGDVGEGTSYYEEYKTETNTGLSGQLVYVQPDKMEGCLISDTHNITAKILDSNSSPASSQRNWYRNASGASSGQNDSRNDLYVIKPAPTKTYEYYVKYYDADDLSSPMRVQGPLTSTKLPVKPTDKMMNMYASYTFMPNHEQSVLELDAADFANEEVIPSLELYFKKDPTYTIKYIDYETKKEIKTSERIEAPAGSRIDLSANTAANKKKKIIDGYDYYKDASTELINSVNEDSTSEIVLYFLSVKNVDYTIEYYDVSDTTSPVAIAKLNGKAGTTVTLDNGGAEITGNDGFRYRVRSNDPLNNGETASGVLPRPITGEQLVLKAYCDKVEKSFVTINSYRYNGSTWVRLFPQEIVDNLNAGDVFDALTYDNAKYKSPEYDNVRYILVPGREDDMSRQTKVVVRPTSEPSAVVNLYYAALHNGDELAVQKTPNQNGLVPIERAATRDFIKINVYDYGNKINQKPNATSDNSWPIFKWSDIEPSNNGVLPNWISNAGEILSTDSGVRNYVEETEAGKNSASFTKPAYSPINRLARSSQHNTPSPTTGNLHGGGANAALNGISEAIVSDWGKTTSANPMSPNLGNGAPVLWNGNSLDYLFPTETASESELSSGNFESTLVAEGLDGLFEYDETTGYYSYSSYKNHAELNLDDPSDPHFDVYDAIITPNIAAYQFGNFLPFSKINEQTTRVMSDGNTSNIDNDYIKQQQSYLNYKYNETGDERYKTLSEGLGYYLEKMESEYANGVTFQNMMDRYYNHNGDQLGAPTNAIHPEEVFKNFVGKDAMYSDYSDFYKSLYMIDYDETKNFFFGTSFDMDFVVTQNAKVDDNDMIFDFEGDDDVLVYIDGVLFLNLSGVHRQCGGTINFTTGEIMYRDFDQFAGVTKQAQYAAHNDYRDATKGIVHFDEVLRDAGMSQSQINDILTEDGIFKDWSQHNFKMFYVERGSGSGVMQLNFNLPAIPEDSIIISKNVTGQNDVNLLSSPYFNFQVLKATADGEPQYTNGNPALLVKPGTEYYIYKDGKNTDQIRVVDDNGMIKLKDGEFAVIPDVKRDKDRYVVQELLEEEYAAQYDSVFIKNTLLFSGEPNTDNEYKNNGYSSDETVNYVEYNGKKYLVRSSYAMTVNGDDCTATLIENHIDKNNLGAIAVSKDMIGDAWEGRESEPFKFAVILDGKLLQSKVGDETVYYHLYDRDNVTIKEDGSLVIDESALSDENNIGIPVGANGIIEVPSGKVAVLKYLLAGSKYEIVEVSDSTEFAYHPVYDKEVVYKTDDDGNLVLDDNGEKIVAEYKNVYGGYVSAGSHITTPVMTIKNQRAENLVIGKRVVGGKETPAGFQFKLSIKYDDAYVDDTYYYDVLDINEPVNAVEYPFVTDVAEAYSSRASMFEDLSASDITGRVPHDGTVTFVDGEASLTIPSNKKIVIYGLPYQGRYTVEETDNDGYYTTYQRVGDETAQSGDKTKEYVLAPANVTDDTDEALSANELLFTNTKTEELNISKTVLINGLDAIFGDYDDELNKQFAFKITATSGSALAAPAMSGEFAATLAKAGSDDSESATVKFVNGVAQVKLYHEQNITIHGLPYGMVYTIEELDAEGYDTQYEITGKVSAADKKTESITLTDTQYVKYTNSLITTQLPMTGGIAILLVLLGSVVIVTMMLSNVRSGVRRKAKKLVPPLHLGGR